MTEWRPSPQLRCLYSQRDKALDKYLWACAAVANETDANWQVIYRRRMQRWSRAWTTLANIAYDLEQDEKRAVR